ncbi:unnamed protein product [Rotaria magnacalcarata]|uniref:Uncharacterized protein n=1 Tax=Rotaria magnacalcarata TaxID=392030 RepID=A0A814VVX5_9BILA|nr:unnamed protein product [Rotaria magnacalcarata]CAF4193941.1 unnamed protein product [Rotaria magnacalcarata]CAF4345114.1 unnamed protein product [Rotaria magnacalcarata]CAF4397830.1 unnamed protein product [Rotaria magnacalcarata]
MSIDFTDDTSISDLLNASSSVSCPIPSQSLSTQVTYMFTSMKQALWHDKSHYKILPSPRQQQQQHIQLPNPTLYRLVKRTFPVPCSSAPFD